MKKIKALFAAFVLTCILSMNGVSAGNYISFVGIKLPSWSGVYTSDSAKKTEDNYQHTKTVATTDLVTGGGRAISARVYGVGASYVSAPKGSWVQLKDVSGLTTVIGNHKLQIKATKSTLAKTSYNGIWALDTSAKG